MARTNHHEFFVLQNETVQGVLGELDTLKFEPLVVALRDVRNGRVDSIRSVMHAVDIPTTGQRSASQSLQSIVDQLIPLDPRFRREFELNPVYNFQISVNGVHQINIHVLIVVQAQEFPFTFVY